MNNNNGGNTEKSDNQDYYINENGLLVFTATYHLKRGFCCKNNCKHCPYGFSLENHNSTLKK